MRTKKNWKRWLVIELNKWFYKSLDNSNWISFLHILHNGSREPSFNIKCDRCVENKAKEKNKSNFRVMLKNSEEYSLFHLEVCILCCLTKHTLHVCQEHVTTSLFLNNFNLNLLLKLEYWSLVLLLLFYLLVFALHI